MDSNVNAMKSWLTEKNRPDWSTGTRVNDEESRHDGALHTVAPWKMNTEM